MAQITVKNLTFAYPDTTKKALENISISVEKGEFVLVCGASGCGKTTLLRSLKQSIAPTGHKSGIVMLEEKNVEEIPFQEEAFQVGFVFQKPEHQIVTDKVWHELAFGMENMGMDPGEMRLRVAEMSEYFGLTDCLYEDIEHLSGGQKQVLNIASVMAMYPSILILDEPTAQLDPIMAENLLSMLYRMNRDFGTTIIISEHRLSSLMHMATKMIVMEEGRVIFSGQPAEAAEMTEHTKFFQSLPELVQMYCKYDNKKGKCPLTVAEGKRWLAVSGKRDLILEGEWTAPVLKTKSLIGEEEVLQAKNIWFRYEKNSADIIKGLSFSVKKNEIFGIVGGNGTGKSTLLSILCKTLRPYRGKIKADGKISMLVQDVQCLFVRDTVMQELDITEDTRFVEEVLRFMELDVCRDTHPYDLSGGEQQRLGMAKLLLTAPDILLLDEPTKGLDGGFKEKLGEILCELQAKGKTIVIVSHDIEFLSKYADRCGMFFDGTFVTVKDTQSFIKGNRYYTTEKVRLLSE